MFLFFSINKYVGNHLTLLHFPAQLAFIKEAMGLRHYYTAEAQQVGHRHQRVHHVRHAPNQRQVYRSSQEHRDYPCITVPPDTPDAKQVFK